MIFHGLKGITCTETAISHIDGDNGQLIYRGYDINYLTKNHTFVEVAYLLWFGELPNQQELNWLTNELKARRVLSDSTKQLIKLLPEDMDMMSVMSTVIASLNTATFNQMTEIEQSMMLTAIMPSIIGYRKSVQKNYVIDEKITEDLNHIEYFLHMLTDKKPEPTHVKALDTYMILTIEHGLNASTFSSRVTASTESDMVAAVTSAIGTMKGPLHGGAPTGVLDLLEEVASSQNSVQLIEQKINSGEKLMGFGHRVYKTTDPRAIALKEKLIDMKGNDEWLDLAMNVEEITIDALNRLKLGRGIYTNVEFYAAAIMKAIDMDPALFTPTFTSSRVVGWTTHVMEQAENNVIFRPQSTYIGKFLTHV
ncbi:citrate synthase/methylcitrate synthase [Priestia megaterium]|nr:citrate synthase/methylcitrate synthase [Priestia megaterium]